MTLLLGDLVWALVGEVWRRCEVLAVTADAVVLSDNGWQLFRHPSRLRTDAEHAAAVLIET